MIFMPGSTNLILPNLGLSIAGARGNSALYNSLVAYWKLDEASGNRADSIGSTTLTDNNATGNITGHVYPLAGSFNKALSNWLHTNDNAVVSTGDIDFWISGWFNPATISAGGDDVLGKWNSTANNLEYSIEIYNSSGNRFRWVGSSNGTSVTVDLDNVESSLSTLAWNFFVCWHDSINNVWGYQINNQVRSGSYSGGIRDGVSQFSIGRGVTTRFFNGQIGPVMMGKGYIPTQTDRDFLYNSGAGVTLETMRSQ